MRRILETISDSALLLALIVLLVLPIMAFAGFSPTTQSAKLIARKPAENQTVLGAEDSQDEQIFTEILSTEYDDVQVEEIEKTDAVYTIRVFAGLNPAEDRAVKLIRLTNFSAHNKSVKFKLSDVKGSVDNASISVAEVNYPLKPASVLNADTPFARSVMRRDEELEIGLSIPADSQSPISFVLSVQLLNQ